MDEATRISLLVSLIALCGAQLSTVDRATGRVIFAYPKGVQSERDLGECLEDMSCSVLYRRFWFAPLVERHCRCKPPEECSWTWADYSQDNRTMGLNSRAQLKFCGNVKQLERCKDTEVALTIELDRIVHIKSNALNPRNRTLKTSGPETARANCYCPEPHYWKPGEQEGEFICSKLSKCKAREQCGQIRTDHHSTYYKCSCPEGHQCVSVNKTTSSQQLLFYNGPAYSAFCMPVT